MNEISVRERESYAVIGPGLLGGETNRQMIQADVASRLAFEEHPKFVIDPHGVWPGDTYFSPDPPVIPSYDGIFNIPTDELPANYFVTLRSENNGEVAMRYYRYLLERGRRVMTAEKAALADPGNFQDIRKLSNDFEIFGYDAACGGSTMLVDSIGRYVINDPDDVHRIDVFPNGTMSSIMNNIGPRGSANPKLPEEAVEAAISDGLAEKGSTNLAEIIRGEAGGDTAKKMAIIFNILNLGRGNLLDPAMLDYKLTDEQVDYVIRHARSYRHAVSLIATNPARPEKPVENPTQMGVIGGYSLVYSGFQIVGGFQQINDKPLSQLGDLLEGAGAGALVTLGPPDHRHTLVATAGPGAGPAVTVNAMINNCIRSRRDTARRLTRSAFYAAE